jgi:hypothetical protein
MNITTRSSKYSYRFLKLPKRGKFCPFVLPSLAYLFCFILRLTPLLRPSRVFSPNVPTWFVNELASAFTNTPPPLSSTSVKPFLPPPSHPTSPPSFRVYCAFFKHHRTPTSKNKQSLPSQWSPTPPKPLSRHITLRSCHFFLEFYRLKKDPNLDGSPTPEEEG